MRIPRSLLQVDVMFAIQIVVINIVIEGCL